MNVNIGAGRDSFTHVTHDSVCGKLCNSFVGVLYVQCALSQEQTHQLKICLQHWSCHVCGWLPPAGLE